MVALACSAINDQMTAEFTARNAQSLQQLRQDGDVEIRAFPADVLRQLRDLTDEVINELVARDPQAARINESFVAYKKAVTDWTAISEQAMLNTRAL